MRHLFLIVLLAAALPSGLALAQQKRAPAPEKIKYETLKITAVAGQQIQVRRAYALAIDCVLLEPNRVAILVPPQGGTLTEQQLESFPSFPRDNPRSACNDKKFSTTYAIYKARDDFRGTDRFRFAIVYYNGTANHFDVEVTVWR